MNSISPGPRGIALGCLFGTMLVLEACDWNENRARFDRGPLIRDWVTELIVPAYTTASDRGVGLQRTIETLLTEPDAESLEAARTAWRELMSVLQREEAFRIGPSMDRRYDLYFWPIRPSLIEDAIAGSEPLTPERFERGLAAAAKGLGALEFFLFGPASDRLASGEAVAGRRATFWWGVAGDVVRVVREIESEWTAEGGYAEMLTDPGFGAEFGSDHEVLAALTNQWIIAIEDVKNRKLGRPLGADAGGDPRPASVESPYASLALNHARENLLGVRDLLVGSENRRGLLDEVDRFDPALAEELRIRLDEAIAAVERIPEPLDVAVVERREAVEAAFEALRALLIVAKTDLVTSLGITLSFSDNDGDG